MKKLHFCLTYTALVLYWKDKVCGFTKRVDRPKIHEAEEADKPNPQILRPLSRLLFLI